MTPRDAKLLRDILENAGIADDHVHGVRAETFDRTPALKYVVLHAIQIVGKAAGKLSDEAKAMFPTIPWDEVIGTRHVIVHGYDKVDPEIIISIAKDDLAPMMNAIRDALRAEGQFPK